jgi:putative methionine-R-sulfoxide reductase with GAF domain
MDHYSILDQGLSSGMPDAASPNRGPKEPSLPAIELAPEAVRFPGDDGGKSLSAMAERDLNAALQLLAERAQYIAGASGAAIALREGAEMICRASAGPSAPELGAALQVNSGLSGESVRTRCLLRCDDAESDPRVNRESCRLLGIASVVVMPLVRDGEVNGVFELLSDRAYAFEERDIAALGRLGEMIQTAVDHAEAAKRAEKELGGEQVAPHSTVEKQTMDERTMDQLVPERLPSVESEINLAPSEPGAVAQSRVAQSRVPESRVDDEPILLEMYLREAELANRGERGKEAESPAALPLVLPAATTQEDKGRAEATTINERGNIRGCEACGFPVSQGRKLCLDCEAKGIAGGAPEFLSQFSAPGQGWLRSHLYLVGALLVAAATVALLVWFR